MAQGDAGTAGTNMGKDYEKDTVLKGMPGNRGRDPKRKQPKTGDGSIGDLAFKDSLIIVIAAWVVLLFLAFSLRHHNV